jgi:hypothetical protein
MTFTRESIPANLNHFLVVSLALFIGGIARAETNTPLAATKLPVREKFQLYLLMGQSNMAGRGKIEAEDKTPDSRVFVFTLSNAWELAAEPITRDRKSGLGVGPGLAFGKMMAGKNPGITIGLVPCAVGGTPLKRWERGGDLYSNVVYRARQVMEQGILSGVLWHQGESDSGTKAHADSYGDRLSGMIRDLRTDLNSPNLPFVAGQLGEFLAQRGPDKSPFMTVVNEALTSLPEKVPHTACASSKGFQHKGDGVHFDAKSQREFGRRYAIEMLRLASPEFKPLPKK